jgi:hypothetical protein
MRSISRVALLAVLGGLALAGCGKAKYQCDVYDGSWSNRVFTTYYDANSLGDAQATCESENSPLWCDCYEDG